MNTRTMVWLLPIWMWIIFIPFFLGIGCMGPRPMGDAGVQMIYLVPGDRIILDSGEQAYVDADGYLRGIGNIEFKAVGRKGRDVARELSIYTPFDRYQLVHSGKREIEVRGAVSNPGVYQYPKEEDWTIMDLLVKAESVYLAKSKDYLLVRRAWDFPGAFVFVKGQAIPALTGIGGDDLLLFAGDLIIFPGKFSPVYVFGSVNDRAECFEFFKKTPATLQSAIGQAGGFSKTANQKNIMVYRILRKQKQSVFTLDWQRRKDFVLEAWDIVYVPPKIPQQLVEHLSKK